MSKIMIFKESRYSVRQKIGDARSFSTQNMFPLSSVVPKLPESPYGAKYLFLAENPVFQFFRGVDCLEQDHDVPPLEALLLELWLQLQPQTRDGIFLHGD